MNSDPIPEGGTAGIAAGGTRADTAGAPGGGTPSVAGASSTGGTTATGSGGVTSIAGGGGDSGNGGMAGVAGGVGAGGSSLGGGSGMGGSSGMSGGSGMGGSGMGGSGMGGSGGKGGAAGSGGSGGSTSTGYRYARLVALSEQTGAVWSSAAELQILTTGNAPISRTNWVVTADSQELDNELDPATNAIDGNTATFWHTEWDPPPNNVNDPKLPHYLSVDMVTAHPITGFSYLPRQDIVNGRIKDWEFYVSNNGTTWGTAIKKGTFPNSTALQTVVF